jgi:hypothetical protein
MLVSVLFFSAVRIPLTILAQSGERFPAKSDSLADAGTSVDAGHQEQESQHGELRQASVGLERVDLAFISFSYFISRLMMHFLIPSLLL